MKPTPTSLLAQARVGLRALADRLAPPPVTLAEPTPAETPRRPDYAELGVSGTRMAGGRISGYELNRDLTGSQWVATAEEMTRTDPAAQGVVDATVQTLMSETWEWQPASDDDGQPDAHSQQASSFLNEAFGLASKRPRMTGGWEAAQQAIYRYIPVGYRYLEEIYRIEDGRVWLDHYADREPSAHAEWVTDPTTGDLSAVEQYDWQSGLKRRAKPIPASKLVLFTRGRTGDNFEGVGLCRPMYVWWQLKRHAYDLLAIGTERYAVGTPLVKTNRELLRTNGYSDADIDQLVNTAKAQAKAYISHEQGYLATVEGIALEIFGDNAFDPARLLSVIDKCDEQMHGAGMLGFLRLGINDTGSRSVGEVSESFFRRAAVNHNDYVAQVVTGGTAARLLRWNFPSLPKRLHPRLVHEGLLDSPLVANSAAIGQGVRDGLLTWTDQDEADYRRANKLRPLPKGMQRTALDRTASRDPAAALAAVMAERSTR